MTLNVPVVYLAAVADERAALEGLVARAAELTDRDALRDLAREIRGRLEAGNEIHRTGGHLRSAVRDLVATLDEIYERAFPAPPGAGLATLLDNPWPDEGRLERIGRLEDRAEEAIEAGDVPLLRLLLDNPFRPINRDVAGRALAALLAAGALDAATVERAFAADRFLWRGAEAAGPPLTGVVRDVADELFWRGDGPSLLRPRGLRFVRRAVERAAAEPGTAELFATAELTPAEMDELVAWLGGRTEAEVEALFLRRLPLGDAAPLLPLLGLAAAEPLLRLCRPGPRDADAGPRRYDLAEIRAAAAAAGEDGTRRALRLFPSEAVSAALGLDRAAVEKRVKHNALEGIAAYGLLPLAAGETVVDRYLALRDVAKRGVKLGPNRRHSQAAAVDAALDHLAQVAGYPDAGRLEWECEAGLVEGPVERRIGAYAVAVRADGTDAVIEVVRGGKRLRAVPPEVRKHEDYPLLREHQERLREQARRMRAGLIERLVATGGTLAPDELARLRRLPSGAAMLPGLLWLDRAGAVGLLDDVDTAGPVTAVHPWHLFERDLLAHWQAEIVARRIRQPVKQAFRELYVPTPAERAAGTRSARFAGHRVDGKVAGRLLSARGWRLRDAYDTHQATRPAGPGLTAALACEFHGYFGMGDVVLGEVTLLAGGAAVALDEAPPIAFSEVMRDLDLVASVAGTDPGGYASPLLAHSRAQLLGALVRDLGLDWVAVEGTTAVVRGSRATYRVHLNSGSIHVEPGGYLCVVPEAFGARPHARLFLPFADDDPGTSVVLSKILLLADDERITDRTILAQLERLSPS
ncbi:DUF4132 domain-containing protein [Dactylosporangium salmoneum]|uniref:DUF4132 domain-containing protein n=1 Tax=Dactylosporangium salmoneum TaxID=53361 RepID=A0ABP5UR50_9ACTN